MNGGFVEFIGFMVLVFAAVGGVIGIIWLIARFVEVAGKVDELHKARKEKGRK